jgi:hypothetical protein
MVAEDTSERVIADGLKGYYYFGILVPKKLNKISTNYL